MLNFIRPSSHKVPYPSNPKGLKLLARLLLGLSHLPYHKFKHKFLDTINSAAVAALMLKQLSIFFVNCPNFLKETTTLLSKTSENNSDIITCTDFKKVSTLLFGDTLFNHFDNNRIFNESSLTMSWPIRSQCTLFLSPEKIRKPRERMNWERMG